MPPAELIDHSPHQPDPSPPVPTASNLILIDNYDSFTWNIYQYLVLEGAVVTVFRNDKITLEELIAKNPTQIIISPGPGHPKTDSGISRDVIRHFAGKVPVLGVCMGLQCIFDVYGGEVSSAGEWLHGKTSPLTHDGRGVFAGLPQGFPVTRYHSLAGTRLTLPACLKVSSWVDKDDGSPGVIQGVRHNDCTVEGVQFHPESILTAGGRQMIKNFLHMQGGTWDENERLQKRKPEPEPEAQAKPGAAKPEEAGAPSKPEPKPKSNNILKTIYEHRRAAVALQREIPSQRMSDLQAAYDLNAAPPLVPLVDRIRQSPFEISLFAEIKRASPSKGVFALETCAPEQARKYALAGASVISVLTEPEWFKGSIEDLRAVRQVLNGMPNRPAILRKEFIFDEYQILEARLAGADTVLLIVKMLDDELLARLYKYSLSLGMEPLVEVQTAEEMTRAIRLGSKVIGVNNRNLETFEVDTKTTGRLRSMVPETTIIAALSGISSHADVRECLRDGINGILVGEAIMKAHDATVFISELCSGRKPPSPEEEEEEEEGRESHSGSGSAANKKLHVKICGTRTPEAALHAIQSGADLVGICLVPGAKRCIDHETALAISRAVHAHADSLPAAAAAPTTAINKATVNKATDFFSSSTTILDCPRPKVVGIFQNQSLSEILEKQKLYNLDIVQLHGNEPIEWATLIPVPVIRAFKPTDPGLALRGYHAVPLLDSGAGSGRLIDVSAVIAVLQKDPDLRVILAGGLTPENVKEVIAALGHLARQVIGVDVSSGVEEPEEEEEGGAVCKQSHARISAFIKAGKELR